MKRRPGFFLQVVPALLYIAAVFYGGSMADPTIPELEFEWTDKVVHFAAFGGMVFVLLRPIHYLWPELERRIKLLIAVITSATLGALLEFYQAGLPHRSADFWDWVADVLGTLAAAMLWLIVIGPRKPEPSPGVH